MCFCWPCENVWRSVFPRICRWSEVRSVGLSVGWAFAKIGKSYCFLEGQLTTQKTNHEKVSRKLDFCLKGSDLCLLPRHLEHVDLPREGRHQSLQPGSSQHGWQGAMVSVRTQQQWFRLCPPTVLSFPSRLRTSPKRCDMQLQNNRCSWNNDVVILTIRYVWLFFCGVASKVGPMPICSLFQLSHTLIFWPFKSVFISHLCLCGLKAFLMEQKNNSPRFLWIKVIQTYSNDIHLMLWWNSHLQRMDPMWPSEGGCHVVPCDANTMGLKSIGFYDMTIIHWYL